MHDELVVDNFAGGGGASCGIRLALGRDVDIAVNHDASAIAMHKVNHPTALHLQEDVWKVDPVAVCKGHPVALAWFSPDCKHFSKAKGGKPRDKKIRGLAWVAVRWAKAVHPRVIMMENVEEIQTWGPLLPDGHPDPQRAGETYQRFLSVLRRQGYEIETRELVAADYGAPTTRKRWFLIARCDGIPIRWPEPTHMQERDRGTLLSMVRDLPAWRSVAEVIDWSLPCPSIFAASEEIYRDFGIRTVRPLAQKTMARIFKGVQRFVMDDPHPFLIQYHDSKDFRGQGVNEPIQTIDASNRYGLVVPLGVPGYAPLPTVTAGDGHFGAVKAFLLSYYGNEGYRGVDQPMPTATGHDRFGLVTIQGAQYKIADIGLRMLTPRELFDAQGFPHDYIIDKGIDGVALTRSQQVARCGNAVCPPLAEALVRANLPEMCEDRKELTA